MKSIGSTGAQWRASLRQPNNRMSSISKRIAALNQRGIGPHRRTFVFHGSKNRTPGSYRQQNSCDFASLGASLKSEVTSSRGGDSIVKMTKRQSTKLKKDDTALRKSSIELIGVTPPLIEEIVEVSPESSAQSPHPENANFDVDQNTSDPYTNTKKFLENYREMVFCCNLSTAATEPEHVECAENNAVDCQQAPTLNTVENTETLLENVVVENQAESNSLSVNESPCNEAPAAVEITAMDSDLKSNNEAPVPVAQNSILENIAMVTVSVKSPTDPELPPHQSLAAPEQAAIKARTFSRKRRSNRKLVKKSIFQTDSQSEDDSSHVRYRKLFYNERDHKWVQHLILEEDDEPCDIHSKCNGENEKFVLPHLVKGRQTEKFKQWLPTAFIKTEKNKCFYDKIHVTDELRMELHKRKMPVVGSYFQEHLFKFGKLPFRGNPRPH